MNSFDEKIREISGDVLRAKEVAILQVNIGYACNMSCKHCHLSAGPDRHELMSREIMEDVLRAVRQQGIKTVDITGGAPELNPHMMYLAAGARASGAHVVIRTNLTVLLEPGMEDLPEFYREQGFEVVASLPHFLGASVDRVRGEGTFEKSLRVLRRFNGLGYGKEGTGLILNLVYNPPGALISGSQAELEKRYREELAVRGVSFNRLFTFTNMALGRFQEFLVRSRGLEDYMAAIRKAFNPATLDGLMCRHLLSVRWDGTLFDCDFNQVPGLPVGASCPRHISSFRSDEFAGRRIVTGDHCFVCTAGAGTS
ncbi:MAG TPA: arsenosugar biosynthesis radical SAM protein ArsS [Syntrophales bacterium]|nr:arsenosugar biosynthesis radical SAM protein ArsS [Syntrophales bacterium]HQM29172.1 arsenosugar biosynthesis radical SAM protein ArsS [Syntrophales bacterium]